MLPDYKKTIDITTIPDTTFTTTVTDGNVVSSQMTEEDLKKWFQYYSPSANTPEWMMQGPIGYLNTFEDVKKPKLPKRPFFCPLSLITRLNYVRNVEDNKFSLLDDLEMILEYITPVVEYSKGTLYLFDAKLFKEVKSRLEVDSFIHSAINSTDNIAEAIERFFRACKDPMIENILGTSVPLRKMTTIELHLFTLQTTSAKKLAKLVDTLLDCCWKLSNNRRVQKEQLAGLDSFYDQYKLYKYINPWKVEMMNNPIMNNKIFYSTES